MAEGYPTAGAIAADRGRGGGSPPGALVAGGIRATCATMRSPTDPAFPMTRPRRPNLIVILVDDLRFDEVGFVWPPVHEDAAHRPDRHGRRELRERLPHDAAVLAQPRVDRHRPVREPPRRDRQRRARRAEPPVAELPRHPAAAGLRHGPRRQMAHGQQCEPAPGLLALGQLPGPRQHRRPGAQHRRRRAQAHRLHHRPAQRARAGLHRAPPRPPVLAVPRAQGGAPRRVPGARRHAGPRGRRLPAGRSAQGPVPRCSISRRGRT